MVETTCKHCGALIEAGVTDVWFDFGDVSPEKCQDSNKNHEPNIWHTQGGGSVVFDNGSKRYIFIVPPDTFPNMHKGDFMPESWTIE